MEFGIYSIRDEAAQGFCAPLVEAYDEMAVRKFKIMQQNNDAEFKYMPEDFSLWKLGIYNNESGKIEGYSEPVLMMRGTKYEEA